MLLRGVLSFLALCAAVVVHANPSQAAVIAGWDFNGLTDGGPNNLSASTENAAVAVQGLARNWVAASDPQARAGANSFGSNGLTEQSQAAAIGSGGYMSFSITTLEAGVSLTDIAAYNIWLYGQEPSVDAQGSDFFGAWQYSIDGTNFADIGTSFQLGSTSGDPGNSQSAVSLSGITDLQSMPSGTTVDFRFVIWGSTFGANYAGFNSFQTGDDLIVNGSVPVPEPSTAMLGFAALSVGLLAVRSGRSAKNHS